MNTIIRKTVVTEYIEITRQDKPTIQARVIEPEQHCLAKPEPAVQMPRAGDIVEYTGKASGRTGTYRVHSVSDDGNWLVLKGYNRKNGFRVPASACTYVGRRR